MLHGNMMIQQQVAAEQLAVKPQMLRSTNAIRRGTGFGLALRSC